MSPPSLMESDMLLIQVRLHQEVEKDFEKKIGTERGAKEIERYIENKLPQIELYIHISHINRIGERYICRPLTYFF